MKDSDYSIATVASSAAGSKRSYPIFSSSADSNHNSEAEPVERPPTSPNNPGLNDNPATPNTPATAPTKPGTPENGLPTPEKVGDQPRPPRRNPPRRRLPPERYRIDAPPPHKPPTAGAPGRSRNPPGTNLDLKQVLSGHPGSAVPSDPDPIQDSPGHLGPAVPSATPTTTGAKTTTAESPKCGPSALQNADPQPSAPRRNPARRRLQPERYPGNLYNSHKPLSAQERRNAAAYDKMVAIRDRMTTPPTAGPSGRNHPPPPTSNPGPTQDPPGHLGPVVPSVGAPSNRKPEGDRHGQADLGVVGKKPVIRSITSGSRGAVQPEACRGPAWTGRPRRRQDDVSSRNRNPKTTGNGGHLKLSIPRTPRPRRDHIDPQGLDSVRGSLHSTRSWAPRPSRIPRDPRGKPHPKRPPPTRPQPRPAWSEEPAPRTPVSGTRATIALFVLAVALVSALPAVNDESLLNSGDLYEAEVDGTFNPQDPQAFIKLKKLKKLLFLG
nr:proline-rich protein HaeIII subfamily 1-like [Aedes albopictus]